MQPATQQERILFRPVEGPDLFGISRSTVYRWFNDAGIKPNKRGNVALFRVSDMKTIISGLEDQLGDQKRK